MLDCASVADKCRDELCEWWKASVRIDRDEGDHQDLSTIAFGKTATLLFRGQSSRWFPFLCSIHLLCRAVGSGGHGRETRYEARTRRTSLPTRAGSDTSVGTPQDKGHFVRYSMTMQTLPYDDCFAASMATAPGELSLCYQWRKHLLFV